MITNGLWFGGLDLFTSIVIVIFCKAIDLPVGNSGCYAINRALRNDPLETMFKGVIYAPILEELIFRLIPICILTTVGFLTVGATNWGWAIVTSFAFALVHGLEDDHGDVRLPIPQFAGGLIFWYAARHYGICTSILAHASVNFIALFLTLIRL